MVIFIAISPLKGSHYSWKHASGEFPTQVPWIVRQVARSDGFVGHSVQLTDHIAVVSGLNRYVVNSVLPILAFITWEGLTRKQPVRNTCENSMLLETQNNAVSAKLTSYLIISGRSWRFTKQHKTDCWSIKRPQHHGHAFIVWIPKIVLRPSAIKKELLSFWEGITVLLYFWFVTCVSWAEFSSQDKLQK